MTGLGMPTVRTGGHPVPMHPEPGERPGEIRWIIPSGVLPVRGPVYAPGALGAMQADGTITGVTVGPRSVLTVADASVWPRIGPMVRTALGEALRTPGRWHPVSGKRVPDGTAAAGEGSDAAIAAIVREVIATQVGDHFRSHGGRIDLIDVHDGVVTVDLAGACTRCPAAQDSLHGGFEAELRRRCRDVVQVRRI